MSEQSPRKHEFQAEVRQVLDIVINSLYKDKEVFIRELVSNASDALEKLRHIQLTEKDIYDDELPLEINIRTDEEQNTITIEDHGAGMSEEELVHNLGTIAHSGSKAFLKAVREAGTPDPNLIGQFGVGFYSVFMVADSVEVHTHDWRKDGKSLVWKSGGSGSYEIETVTGERRGTKIVAHLKDDAKEFANADRVRDVLTHYSSFVQFPIKLNGEQVNTVQPIWTRNRSGITDEEYNEFYKFQANAFDDPLYRLHFSSDAPLEISALVFVPGENPERWGFGKVDPGVALYSKKILIDPKPDGLLPDWLRFLRGVVDSSDIPLNISRESMQDSALTKRIGQVITGRFIKFLEDEAGKDAARFEDFYRKFSIYLKEGIASDLKNRDQLAKLLRYESSATEKGNLTTLGEYVSRIKDGQKEIYYLYAPSREIIEAGPHVEAFKARGLEVIYLYDPVDEFVMTSLGKYDDKELVSADNAAIDFGDDAAAAPESTVSEDDAKALTSWFKDVLGDRVNEVVMSRRLVDSPAVALNADKLMTPSMRRMMKAIQREGRIENSINLELNPAHKLIAGLSALRDKDPETAKLVAEQIFDNALVAAGFMEDAREMVGRVYSILERVTRS
jgi:molecular chaperone HtpG